MGFMGNALNFWKVFKFGSTKTPKKYTKSNLPYFHFFFFEDGINSEVDLRYFNHLSAQFSSNSW